MRALQHAICGGSAICGTVGTNRNREWCTPHNASRTSSFRPATDRRHREASCIDSLLHCVHDTNTGRSVMYTTGRFSAPIPILCIRETFRDGMEKSRERRVASWSPLQMPERYQSHRFPHQWCHGSRASLMHLAAKTPTRSTTSFGLLSGPWCFKPKIGSLSRHETYRC